jgi:type VI secretion system protein ImpH
MTPDPLENQAVAARFEPLRRLLLDEPFTVRFFQAVRLLSRLYPERRPVGLFVAPSSEVVRFSSPPSLSFPPSEVHSFTESAAHVPHRMAVQFMGLASHGGPLPDPYTELLLERIRARDFAPGDFLDIFNHRLVSLFFRAWQKYHFCIGYERAAASGDAASDPITARLFDLIGLGTAGLGGRFAMPDAALLPYSGLLGQTRRTAEGLRRILEDYFEVPVEIGQFTGSWKRLPPTNLTFLQETGSFAERLGQGTVVGDEVWDQHGTVTIRLGPMRLARYLQFLPGAAGYRELASWLRFYARREFDFLIRLVLARQDVPPVDLGAKLEPVTPAESPPAQLGLVSWLKTRPLGRDPDEATYRLQ